jgi:hypothetical protein
MTMPCNRHRPHAVRHVICIGHMAYGTAMYNGRMP